jgi:hypothetical protein
MELAADCRPLQLGSKHDLDRQAKCLGLLPPVGPEMGTDIQGYCSRKRPNPGGTFAHTRSTRVPAGSRSGSSYCYGKPYANGWNRSTSRPCSTCQCSSQHDPGTSIGSAYFRGCHVGHWSRRRERGFEWSHFSWGCTQGSQVTARSTLPGVEAQGQKQYHA